MHLVDADGGLLVLVGIPIASSLRHYYNDSVCDSGAKSWRSEYKRLVSKIPMVKTDELKEHAHQVLHVSFSHNGKLFATCSKDGYVIVSRYIQSSPYLGIIHSFSALSRRPYVLLARRHSVATRRTPLGLFLPDRRLCAFLFNLMRAAVCVECV